MPIPAWKKKQMEDFEKEQNRRSMAGLDKYPPPGEGWIRAPFEYVSPRKVKRQLTPQEETTRHIAYALKEGRLTREAAIWMNFMLRELRGPVVFVPVPDSKGKVGINRKLCDDLCENYYRHSGFDTRAAMTVTMVFGEERPSQCARDRSNMHRMPVSKLLTYPADITLPVGWREATIILVDNVAWSGNTLEAARRAVIDGGHHNPIMED